MNQSIIQLINQSTNQFFIESSNELVTILVQMKEHLNMNYLLLHCQSMARIFKQCGIQPFQSIAASSLSCPAHRQSGGRGT
jgi:16S rRNA C1402 (ribose-2'-O) methylase RsmI